MEPTAGGVGRRDTFLHFTITVVAASLLVLFDGMAIVASVHHGDWISEVTAAILAVGATLHLACLRAGMRPESVPPAESGGWEVAVPTYYLERPVAPRHFVAAAGCFVAALLALAPVLFRGWHGWPENDHQRPGRVVGPGEEVKVLLPGRISPAQGLWRGTPRLTVLSPELALPLTFEATGSNAEWGRYISKKTGRGTRTSYPCMCAFAFPTSRVWPTAPSGSTSTCP